MCHQAIIDKLVPADSQTVSKLAYAYDAVKHPEVDLELLPKILKGDLFEAREKIYNMNISLSDDEACDYMEAEE